MRTRGTELKILYFQHDGHQSNTKRLVYNHLLEPSDIQVVTWGVFFNDTCKSILGSPTNRIYETVMTCQRGVIRAGMIGFRENVANILAVIFIADNEQQDNQQFQQFIVRPTIQGLGISKPSRPTVPTT